MRFVCDSCRAQYMISDDKVGAKGVKVRCKKCGHNIVVRPAGSAPVKEDGTGSEAAGGAAASQGQSSTDGFGVPASLGTPPEGGIFGGSRTMRSAPCSIRCSTPVRTRCQRERVRPWWRTRRFRTRATRCASWRRPRRGAPRPRPRTSGSSPSTRSRWARCRWRR
ncbi:MJ0042-type zinc finger domain-containing protein [Cystobacter fuscus]